MAEDFPCNDIWLLVIYSFQNACSLYTQVNECALASVRANQVITHLYFQTVDDDDDDDFNYILVTNSFKRFTFFLSLFVSATV